MGGFIPCESHPKSWAEIFVKRKKRSIFPLSGTLSGDAGRQAHRHRQYHIGIACTTTFSQQSNNRQLLQQDSHRPTGDCCSSTRLRNLEAGAQVPETSMLNLTPDLENLGTGGYLLLSTQCPNVPGCHPQPWGLCRDTHFALVMMCKRQLSITVDLSLLENHL